MKNYKLANFCEFDGFATKSYEAIHNEDDNKNLGDITKVDETKLEPFTMICGGSPCQDFSVAGKQKGSVWTCKKCGHEYNPLTVHFSERDGCPKCHSKEIEKTRSSLLVEWLRVIRANKPNFGIYENVKNIVGKQFKETTFKLFTDELEEYGYNVHWKVLNAKNYGIPQNRERLYLLLIKKELDNGKFEFPVGFDNGLRLSDLLEDEVDEKYYLSDDKVKNIVKTMNGWKLDTNNLNQKAIVHDTDGICRTITGQGHCGNEPKVAIKQVTKKGYIECKIGGVADLSYPDLTTRRGRVQDGGNISPTITATETGVCVIEGDEEFLIRVRKLTPKECYLLMGFTPSDFHKAKASGTSDSQLYKQAGNSIVVDVLYYIYRELYKAMPYLFDDLTLSSYFSGIGAFESALDRLYEDINSGNFTKPSVE